MTLDAFSPVDDDITPPTVLHARQQQAAPRMTLHPFQQEIFSKALVALYNGHNPLVQLATGGGKTHIAAHLARVLEDKVVWFVCHRQELMEQTVAIFKLFGVRFGVVSAKPVKGANPDPNARVQICMVRSLPRRQDKLRKPDIVMFDECHHLAARTWANIAKEFPNALRIGLTATPYRLDGAALSPHFDQIIEGPTVRELIDGDYLSDFEYWAPSQVDLSGVRINKGGEYDQAQLEAVMADDVLIGDVVTHYKICAKGEKALVYAVSVDASKEIVARFNKAGVPAAHIDFETPDHERATTLEALKRGDIKVVSNVELFTEGLDIPAIGAVILMRPTRSLGLARQMIGRGMRASDHSRKLIILDHANLYAEHGTPDLEFEWTLDGRPPKLRPGSKGRPVKGGDGRQIEYVPGFLSRIEGGMPEGCETKHAFSKRTGITATAIAKAISKGLPNIDGFILIKEGLAWFEANPLHPPEGCETQTAFAKRVGVSREIVAKGVAKGLPNIGGFVCVEKGLAWVAAKPLLNDTPEGCETQRAFARRTGLHPSDICNALKRGLPHVGTFVLIEEGEEWLKHNRKSRGAPLEGYEKKGDFCRRVGISAANLHRLIKRGMPEASYTTLHTDTCEKWLVDNWGNDRELAALGAEKIAQRLEKKKRKAEERRIKQELAKPPKKAPSHTQYLNLRLMNKFSRKGFAEEIGVNRGTVKRWLKEGMPISEDGFIDATLANAWIDRHHPRIGSARGAARKRRAA